MSYRVVQCATGAVGLQALRAILARPDLELVGVRVYGEGKAGLDAGAIAGTGAVDVPATADLAAALALHADCAVYTALGDTLDPDAALDEICAFLAAGTSVVTSAVAVPLSADAAVNERLGEACRRGGSTFFAAGLNPGFLLDVWPILMSRVMRRVDRVALVEMDDMSDYTSAQVLDFMAFGASPDEPNMWVPASGRVEDTTLYRYFLPASLLIERAVGLRVEEYLVETDFAVAEAPVQMAAKRVEAGTISAIWSRLVGRAGSSEVLRFDAVYTSGPAPPRGWPADEGKSRWRLRMDGDPVLETTLRLSDTRAGDRADMVATASHLVNAVPAVCAAPPGVRTLLDLPTFAGVAGTGS